MKKIIALLLTFLITLTTLLACGLDDDVSESSDMSSAAFLSSNSK